jgi:hypothetical protein
MTALYRLHLAALSAAADPNPHRFMTKSFGSTHRSTLDLIHARRRRSHNMKGKGRSTIGKARKRHKAEEERCRLLLLRRGGSNADNLLLELPCHKIHHPWWVSHPFLLAMASTRPGAPHWPWTEATWPLGEGCGQWKGAQEMNKHGQRGESRVNLGSRFFLFPSCWPKTWRDFA